VEEFPKARVLTILEFFFTSGFNLFLHCYRSFR